MVIWRRMIRVSEANLVKVRGQRERSALVSPVVGP
jgi:hypothetical protein